MKSLVILWLYLTADRTLELKKMRYLTTKGLFLRHLDEQRYTLEDVFGVCTLPIVADNREDIAKQVKALAGVDIICCEVDLGPMSSPQFARWFELEEFYVARISDHYRYWQVGRNLVPTYDSMSALLPIAYFESGYGSGNKNTLEHIDKMISSAAAALKTPFTSTCVAIRLSHIQIERMCSDLMSLLNRAIRSFLDFLSVQRRTIIEENWAREHMDVSEIVHSGPKSYEAASLATMCVISLCTSLDISSKLIHCLNSSACPTTRFRPSQGRHFSDLQKLKPNSLPGEFIDKILQEWSTQPGAAALIQFRHDLVHNTAALELEKIYVGTQTDEINGLPLHYAFVPWRDCTPQGQPLRYLGRDYFISEGANIESQLFNWLNSVISFHIHTGHQIKKFLVDNTKDHIDVNLVNFK